MEKQSSDSCLNQALVCSSINVKALALFFQEKSSSSIPGSKLSTTSSSTNSSPDVTRCLNVNKETRGNHEENLISVDDEQVINNPSSLDAQDSPSRDQRSFSARDQSSQNEMPTSSSLNCNDKDISLSGCPSGLQTKMIPIPKPRLSLLRKQLEQRLLLASGQGYNSQGCHRSQLSLQATTSHSNYRQEGNNNTISCLEANSQDDGYEISRTLEDTLPESYYHDSHNNHDDEEDTDDELDDIYEELPAEYHDIRLATSTRSLDHCASGKTRIRKSSISFLKEKVLSVGRSRLLDAKSNSKRSFFPSRPVKDLPKPPSVDELNHSLRLMSLEAGSSCQNLTSSKQDVYYNDTRDLGSDGTEGGGGPASDEYCDGYENEGLYEDMYNSSSNASDRTYESLPGEEEEKENNDTTQDEKEAMIPCVSFVDLPPCKAPRPSLASMDRVEYVEIDQLKTAELEKKIAKEQKLLEKRQKEQAEKLRKKFHVTGQEIPVNHGIVKEDARKTSHKIKVKKGEVVLILRMENNPPGLWLAKNERSEIGFVEVANISCDAETVKTLMKANPHDYGCL